MLIGNLHIQIPDGTASTREDVESLCATLDAQRYGQEYLVETTLQSLLIQAVAPVTCTFAEEMDFDLDQIQFCHECEASFIAQALPNLQALILKNVQQVGYDRKEIGVTLDDMRITAALVFLEETSDEFEEFLNGQMATEYERTKGIP
tara:strand:- start:1651 stop:2094 length:444 start_codon:yes stop_codon:yes gene_type:complete